MIILTSSVLSSEDKIILSIMKKVRDQKDNDTIPYEDLVFFTGFLERELKGKIVEFKSKKLIATDPEVTRWRLDFSSLQEEFDKKIELQKICKSGFIYNEAKSMVENNAFRKKMENMEKKLEMMESISEKDAEIMSVDNLFTYFRKKYKENKGNNYDLSTKGKDLRLIKMLKDTQGGYRVVKMIDYLFKKEREMKVKYITVGTLWGFRDTLLDRIK